MNHTIYIMQGQETRLIRNLFLVACSFTWAYSWWIEVLAHLIV